MTGNMAANGGAFQRGQGRDYQGATKKLVLRKGQRIGGRGYSNERPHVWETG